MTTTCRVCSCRFVWWPPMVAVLAVLPMVALLAGCDRSPSAQSPAAAPPQVVTLQVRGQVAQLPQKDGPDHALYLHHEAIPDFVDENGQKAPMHEMTMPFELAPDVPLGDIAVGDKVGFSLVVDWNNNRIQITKIARLPADTMLHFKGMGHMDMNPPATAPAQ